MKLEYHKSHFSSEVIETLVLGIVVPGNVCILWALDINATILSPEPLLQTWPWEMLLLSTQ